MGSEAGAEGLSLVCLNQKLVLHLVADVGMLRGSEQKSDTVGFMFYSVLVAA